MLTEETRLHRWDVSPAEAQALQSELRHRVRIEPLDIGAIKTVAGADLSFNQGSDTVYAGIVVLDFPSLEIIEKVGLETLAPFPYIPGLLSFREVPPLLEVWSRLQNRPDALICDGQGLAHPRRFGLACHLGVLLDVPAIGCAKSLYVGHHEPPGEQAGDWTPLIHREEEVGAVFRTRTRVSPVYVSVGHRCDLTSARELVMRCVARTRLPETTRQAHLFVNTLRRNAAL